MRHFPVDISSEICYGQSNVGLKIPIDELYLSNKVNFDIIYSSPLLRCISSTEALGFKHFILDERLQELNFGDWELKSWTNIYSSNSSYWFDDFVNQAPPNGESFKQMYRRVMEFFESLEYKKNTKVLIVTHAGVIRCILAYILEFPLKNAFKIQISYGEIIKIGYSENRNLIKVI